MKNNIFSFLAALLAGSLLLSCEDEKVYFQNFAPGKGAKIKFVHAASDTVGVNLFLGGTKITANSPSTITTAGAPNFGKVNIGTVGFVGTFPITNYTTVSNATGDLSVVYPESYDATLTFRSRTHSVNASALSESAYYTVAFLGLSPSYETVVYEDDLSTAPVDGQVYVRFANFIHNSAGNLSLRATPPATADDPTPAAVILFPNIAYKGMTGFLALPRSGTYTSVQILNASNNTVIATLSAANSGWIANKVYTIFAHGRVGGTGGAAPGGARMINR